MTSSYTVLLLFQVQIHSTIIFISQILYTSIILTSINHFIWSTTPPFLWGQQTFCTEIVHCFPGPSGVLFYLVDHSSSSATAHITDTRTVQVFAQGVIVCMIVTARALVTVLCYLCILKCLFIIIIIIALRHLAWSERQHQMNRMNSHSSFAMMTAA